MFFCQSCIDSLTSLNAPDISVAICEEPDTNVLDVLPASTDEIRDCNELLSWINSLIWPKLLVILELLTTTDWDKLPVNICISSNLERASFILL